MEFDPYPPRPQAAPLGLWQSWSALRILLLILVLGLLNFSCQILVFMAVGGLFLPVTVGATASLLTIFVIFRSQGFSLAMDLRLGAVTPLALGLALVMALAALPPSSLLAELSLRLHPADPQWIRFYADNLKDTPAQMALAALGGVVLAPLVEEILFRGLLQRLVGRAWGPWAGIVVSALVFGLVHGEPWFLFGLIMGGLVLGFLYEATGSLSACWAAHALHNAVSLVILFVQQDTSLQPSELHLGDWLLGAGSVVVLGVVGGWMWRNHGER